MKTLPLSTIVTGIIVVSGTAIFVSFIFFSRSSAAILPTSNCSIRIVVSPGGILSINGISLKPVIEISVGHFSPLAVTASKAPKAKRSFAHKIAVILEFLQKLHQHK